MTVPGWVMAVLLLMGTMSAAAIFINPFLAVLLAFAMPWVAAMLAMATGQLEQSP